MDEWIKPDGIRGLVSVLIPAYNCETTVRDSLDSVLSQDYRPIELVVVDDGSSDGTQSLVAKWLSEHNGPDFRCNLIVQANRGLMVCRNLLTLASKGAMIQMLDADDILHPSKLSVCSAAFEEGPVDVVVPRTSRFHNLADIKSLLTKPPRVEPLGKKEQSALIGVASWFTAGPLFSRRIVSAAGPFPENLHPVAEEMEFHARVKCIAKSVLYRPEILSFYRVGQGRKWNTDLAGTCQGRIEGANAVLALLRKHGIRSRKEYRALVHFAAQTFSRVSSSRKCTQLVTSAHSSLLEAVQSCLLPLHWVLKVIPTGVMKIMCRRI